MDGDGDNEAATGLIGYSKENTPQQAGDGDSRINWVAQHKDQGAEDKGYNHTPPSQETIEYSPKEEFFCYGRYDPANNEKKDEIAGLCRYLGSNECEWINGGNKQSNTYNGGYRSKGGRPYEPLFHT